jgi:hypothetical protein
MKRSIIATLAVAARVRGVRRRDQTAAPKPNPIVGTPFNDTLIGTHPGHHLGLVATMSTAVAATTCRVAVPGTTCCRPGPHSAHDVPWWTGHDGCWGNTGDTFQLRTHPHQVR